VALDGRRWRRAAHPGPPWSVLAGDHDVKVLPRGGTSSFAMSRASSDIFLSMRSLCLGKMEVYSSAAPHEILHPRRGTKEGTRRENTLINE